MKAQKLEAGDEAGTDDPSFEVTPEEEAELLRRHAVAHENLRQGRVISKETLLDRLRAR